MTLTKRLEKLEATDAPALAGMTLLASLWGKLGRKHPVLKERCDAKRVAEQGGDDDKPA